jgi:hypothetical protein
VLGVFELYAWANPESSRGRATLNHLVNLNAPAGKALTLGREIQMSTLFSTSQPTLILNFIPKIRVSDDLGLLGSFGVSAQDSNSVGFS